MRNAATGMDGGENERGDRMVGRMLKLGYHSAFVLLLCFNILILMHWRIVGDIYIFSGDGAIGITPADIIVLLVGAAWIGLMFFREFRGRRKPRNETGIDAPSQPVEP